MQLTLYTDYSFRTLAYLCLHEEKSCTISEIADFYDISRNHLVKIVHNLSKAGFITSARGKGGGIRLSRPAEQINIIDIVQHTEPSLALVACFNPQAKHTCSIEPICALKGLLANAMSQFLRALENYTVADLLKEKSSWQSINFLEKISLDKQ